jgi:hypothetical protein
MKGCSASGDFDGDLDMVSFDPVLIDLVKATEAGRDVHGGAFPSRGQEAWPKGLIHIQMCFEYIEPMVSKGLSWQKNTRKVVGSGRRNAREKKAEAEAAGLEVVPEKDALAASTTAEEATEACLNDVAPVPTPAVRAPAVRGCACASAERVTEAVLQEWKQPQQNRSVPRRCNRPCEHKCAHTGPWTLPSISRQKLYWRSLKSLGKQLECTPGRQGPQKWLSLPSILKFLGHRTRAARPAFLEGSKFGWVWVPGQVVGWRFEAGQTARQIFRRRKHQ